jgi:hypothetical protein
MSNLIDIYNHMSADRELFARYTSIGKNGYGRMFLLLNTNYRAILARYRKSKGNRYGYGGFAQGFSVLESVEGQDRNAWQKTNAAGQEVEKQHTVHMRKAVFFQVRDNAFYITKRGEVFKRALIDESLSDDEKRLLCFLLILPASFDEIPSYLFKRTAEVFALLQTQGIAEDEVLRSIEDIIIWSNSSNDRSGKEDIFRYDYTYYDSFFVEKADFLSLYSQSSERERNEFKAYIFEEAKKLKKYPSPNRNILSKKYKNSGVYTKTTLIENAWLLYVTKHILDIESITRFEAFIDVVLSAYGKLFSINENSLKHFIYDKSGNRSVFQIVFCELFNVKIPLKDIAKDLTGEEIEQYGVIDPTDENGYNQREIVTSALKKLAKQHSGFKCECEREEDCRYFTAKESGQNYLEIHHFIPREFANDFDESIDVLSNYIALCPNCHKKIHFATDNERKHLIRSLFNDRKDRLAANHLTVDLPKLFEYYKMEK